MKKADLFKEYNKMRSTGKVPESIVLYIHMPSGEQTIIISPDVAMAMEYIGKTYNENLVHTSYSDIFIADVILCVKSDDGSKLLKFDLYYPATPQ